MFSFPQATGSQFLLLLLSASRWMRLPRGLCCFRLARGFDLCCDHSLPWMLSEASLCSVIVTALAGARLQSGCWNEYWPQSCFLAPVLIGGAAQAGLRDSRWQEAALSSRSGALPEDVLCRALSQSCELAERAVTSVALMSPDCGSAGVGAGDPQVFSPGLLARVH